MTGSFRKNIEIPWKLEAMSGGLELNPKGIPPRRGCEPRATLGKAGGVGQPQRGCGPMADMGHNPGGVENRTDANSQGRLFFRASPYPSAGARLTRGARAETGAPSRYA